MKKTYMQPTAKTVKLDNQVILAGSVVVEGENNLNTTGEDITVTEDIAAKRGGDFSYEW
ncbi:MAG: hypothetical protein KBT34_11345 [Prevotella sp.]|nr:hypothetical protein [Candidatus Prevotella equi]